MIFYLYDSTNAVTRQEREKSSNRKNNKRSLSEFETVAVSARKGLFFAKIFVPYLTTAYGQPEKSLISCGFTRLDLFTSTCFCLSWCVTASVISGANGFWLRSILNPPTAKADRAENRIRRYEGEPAYNRIVNPIFFLLMSIAGWFVLLSMPFSGKQTK